MLPLALICGLAFGVVFGLTGVGSVFAVPLLAYGFGLPPHQAVCMAMVSVSVLAATSTALRWRTSEFAVQAGVIMAVAGMLSAPLGAAVGRLLSGRWLMVGFALFVAAIAVCLFIHRRRAPNCAVPRTLPPCFSFPLALAGFAAGFFAGLLGIGGALLTPALVLLGGVDIHRAISTSRPVSFAIGLSAITSHLLGGQILPPTLAAFFIGGGCCGVVFGMRMGHRLSGPRLELVFAVAVLSTAAYVLARQFLG